MMNNSERITTELERIARDYRYDMESAIDNLNEELECDFTRSRRPRTEAVKDAVEAIDDSLSIYSEPQTSLTGGFSRRPPNLSLTRS